MIMIHFDTRSSAKNKTLSEEFVTEIKYFPEIIGIPETKINSSSCLNLNILNFNFFRNDSLTTHRRIWNICQSKFEI